MTTDSPLPSTYDSQNPPAHLHLYRRPLSWGAILAGIFAALSLQVLFVALGAGLGFAIYTPITDENPVMNLGAGAVFIHGISAVFSLWFGGWVAGRFTPMGTRLTGGLHGFLVWAAATILGIAAVSSGVGMAVGGLSKVIGGGMSMAGQTAGAAGGGVAELAKAALKQSSDTMSSFVDEAVAARPAGATPNTTIRAKREIGTAVARMFNPSSTTNAGEARAALVKALSEGGGMSQADAEKTVADWTTSYEKLKTELAAAKNEAEAKARIAAEEAADALSIFSFCAFGALALGASAATFGGEHGAQAAIRRHNRPEVV